MMVVWVRTVTTPCKTAGANAGVGALAAWLQQACWGAPQAFVHDETPLHSGVTSSHDTLTL